MTKETKSATPDTNKYAKLRRRMFDVIEVGYNEDFIGRGYDIINLGMIVVNLIVSIMLTFEKAVEQYGDLLRSTEAVTVAFFAVDLVLRIWTAAYLYPDKKEPVAVLKYLFSFNGIVDVFSCLPYYLPFFFPAGMAAFRIFRVMRIFRIFRLNAYFDSLNVIGAVIKKKSRLLISSVFIILMLMVAASLCMYSLENAVQPDIFDNALSGLWWACAALLTVGYGDLYPITVAGKILGMLITMLGVGLVAIPTGIISAGFVEQYAELKKIAERGAENDLRFISVTLGKEDPWIGKKIEELVLSQGIIIAAVRRRKEILIPRGEVELCEGDRLILGADLYDVDTDLRLKEIELKAQHEWTGQKIKDLDISRKSFIVTVRRGNETIVPRGNLRLREGDLVVLYTKQRADEG